MRYFLVACMALALSACGGDSSNYKYSSPIKLWQSYSASPADGAHYWNNESQEYTITKLPKFADDFKSGYGYVDSEGQLIYANLATGARYKYDAGRATLLHASYSNYFESQKHYYRLNGSRVEACLKTDRENCLGIEIAVGTWPYVYAEAKDNVIAITNMGDAVKFDGQTWCRMSRSNLGEFVCDATEKMVTQPRILQFYSSIKYQGETLIGEWPTGAIYVFDGDTLKPSAKWTPPLDQSDGQLGYEAQSMAEYCGDLFVGYWPRGEIWKYNRQLSKWQYFKRFFNNEGDVAFIPWSIRPSYELDSAFFGQRITALVPHKKSLYVTTSNLRAWEPTVQVSYLNESSIDEYGQIYEIKGKDCLTVY